MNTESKIYSLFLILIFISFKCDGQNDPEKRYVIRDLLGNKLYILDPSGNELAAVNTKDFYITGSMKFNYFDVSKHKIFLTKKTDKSLYSLDNNGKIMPLSKDIKQLNVLTDSTLLLYKSNKLVLCDHMMNELKVIDTPTNYRLIGNGIIVIQNETTAEWHICNNFFEPIHNIGKDALGWFYNYKEGWTLVAKPDQDATLYHVTGKKINISNLLNEKYGIKVNYSYELKISEVSNDIFLVKVGNAYFKIFYFNTNGATIWMSDQLDIKSATSFVDGFATIERYNTTFDEYIKLKKSKNGNVERTYKTVKIDTLGNTINEISTSTPNPKILNNEALMIEEDFNGELLYTDAKRSIIHEQISLTKKYFALIDHTGKVYWENFSKQ